MASDRLISADYNDMFLSTSSEEEKKSLSSLVEEFFVKNELPPENKTEYSDARLVFENNSRPLRPVVRILDMCSGRGNFGYFISKMITKVKDYSVIVICFDLPFFLNLFAAGMLGYRIC